MMLEVLVNAESDELVSDFLSHVCQGRVVYETPRRSQGAREARRAHSHGTRGEGTGGSQRRGRV